MCGIIGIVRRRSSRPAPDTATLVTELDAALGALDGCDAHDVVALVGVLTSVAERLGGVDRALRGVPGVTAMVADRAFVDRADALTSAITAALDAVEAALDEGVRSAEAAVRAESTNAALVAARDAVWAVARDRLRTGREVAALAGGEAGPAAIAAFTSIQLALSGLDRLEVRGRDSAGLHVLVRAHGLALDAPEVVAALADRSSDRTFASRAVRVAGPCLSFVYKAAAEIGELGDNTSALRAAISDDELLRAALGAEDAEAVVLGHTRWASVGIISQPNAHPVNSDEVHDVDLPYVTAALNGDVDNYADLKAVERLDLAPEITTDAKVIPVLVARRLAEGSDPDEAFRRTVAGFEGSVAIAASTAAAPDDLLLALRGSGQALYIGLAEDAFVVASEPYGLVEETSAYLRMDGETPANPDNPTASRGQVVRLRGDAAGTLAGIDRRAYDGTPVAVDEDEVVTAQITTRDIDRGAAPHFLLKEIGESPASFRKTLRGRLVEVDGVLGVRLPDDALPAAVCAALREGAIRRIEVIGQGTAAIAAQAAAAAIGEACAPAAFVVRSLVATELSGFELRDDMRDTLVVAISQSGTTTDTNRTVDLARARGAQVLAIVNRRGSDLTDKAHGVLYTSDGRDVEMSVASTKAFYAQVAAGFLLASALARELGLAEDQSLLEGLRALPEAMEQVVARRAEIAVAARELAPSRRYWAIVGSGWNRIAAQEIRIKLSELCYKSIACDVTEDKKHIDLSSEPMILVCAAGLGGSNADDVAKEIAIYRAHKAAPIVIATEGDGRFTSALHALLVPKSDPRLAFVLAAMVGHLFGYEAALAIDAQARPLREARAAIEGAVADGLVGDDLVAAVVPRLEALAEPFTDALRRGEYDGHLEASTAVRVGALLRYALGMVPLEVYQAEFGRVGTPAVVIDDLRAALTRAIEELTRPVDAIKHQAKTVTVGISRTDETLLQVPLVAEILAAGAPRDRLTYASLRALAALDAVVAEVVGSTRYRIEGRIDDNTATAIVVDRRGIAREFPSRTDRSPELRGTKHRVATERLITVAKGRADGRTVIIVPEVKDTTATGLTLLHVRFAEHPSVAAVRGALAGYRDRLAALRDAVTETEPTFREDLLNVVPVEDLFCLPVNALAEHWRG